MTANWLKTDNLTTFSDSPAAVRAGTSFPRWRWRANWWSGMGPKFCLWARRAGWNRGWCLRPDFALELIDVGPLKNVSLLTRLQTLARLPRSIADCKELMREFQAGRGVWRGRLCVRAGDGGGAADEDSGDGF